MAFYNENFGSRILELMSYSAEYPIEHRCTELRTLFERCSTRELHDIFPQIVHTIFGVGTQGIGWALRTTTKENAPLSFDVLYNFFISAGPMLQLCYRLLNDAVKYEFSLELLPHKVAEMLQSGQYPMFYADLLNVDPFRRQITSLSLNAFDFYILHFVIHATLPLHKLYPAALQVHNERKKTVYFLITAEYLSCFLPCSPDGIVHPTNICTTVKAPQPMPVQPLQPTRSPKYLKIPNAGLYAGNSTVGSPVGSPMTCKIDALGTRDSWRTESVLHFFIDCWLRYDIGQSRDLPSSEFLRLVRILVKNTHAFANGACFNQTTMFTLRKIAQQMLKFRIYPFIKCVVNRWPLDSSWSIVLELWLSYIQPWRYTAENFMGNNMSQDVIQNRYDSFIAENLVIYTQVFAHILSRFERLDFTCFKNAILLHRLVKVFSQSTLPKRLFLTEQAHVGSGYGYDSPQKHVNYLNRNNSTAGSSEWDSFFQEEYKPLYGPVMRGEIEQFIKMLYISRMYVQQEIHNVKQEIIQAQNSSGVFKRFLRKYFKETSPSQMKLNELLMIPDILDTAVNSLSLMFNIDLSNISIEHIEQREARNRQNSFSMYDNSDYLDISRLARDQMVNNLSKLSIGIDPATVPIQSHENATLVRLLHRCSCTLNSKYGEIIKSYWNRTDFYGKLTRQLIDPPMTAHWFDKPRGVNELCAEHLPPRIRLRPLASYKFFTLIVVASIVGRLFWSAYSFGLFILLLSFISYITVKAMLS